MSSALLAGVSGLIAHQRMLEVVGNNLANLNTVGYKSRRILFSDLLYRTIRPASGPVEGAIGGSNPNQVGSGTAVSQIDLQFTQGNLEPTGGLFDYAIQGVGFFVLNDGTQNVYTRAGAFALDQDGTLVDPATGYRVQRTGTVGEPTSTSAGFQIPGDTNISIPLGSNVAGQATANVELSGNLNSSLSGARAEVLTSTAPLESSGSPATAATLLNDLDSNTVDYVVGDSIEITGTDTDGTPVTTTFAVDNTTTLGDLVAAVNAAFSGTTATLDASGNLVFTANTPGDASMNLGFSDSAGNTGGTVFTNHNMTATTDGKEADTVQSSVTVYDAQGGAHIISLNFEKQDSHTWNMTANMSAADGTLTDDSVQQIQFNDDGSFRQLLGTGVGDPQITVQLNGITAPQTIGFSFGSPNSFSGLAQVAIESSLASHQDGFAPGTLVTVNLSADGQLIGVATNGRTIPIAQLAIASFTNPNGLVSRGQNFYDQSLNSGEPQIGTALSGSRGSANGGQLEGANVDVALEFTRLILAQRGFSANARTITVTNQMLEELTNIIR